MATHTNRISETGLQNLAYMDDILIDADVDDDLTGSIDLSDWKLKGIIMPAAWTAADITLLGSHDDTTFNTIYNPQGTVYTLTVTTDSYVIIPLADSASFPRYLKIATSAGQAADRTLVLVLER